MHRPSPALFDYFRGMLDSGDPTVRARAENVVFEQRLSAARLETYRTRCLADPPDYGTWMERHGDHLAGAVAHAPLPETFQAINGNAALPAAVASERGEMQRLARVEPLAPALEGGEFGDVADVAATLDAYGSGNDEERANAKAVLEKLCDVITRHRKGNGPRFAAFANDLTADVLDARWADLLRDRLGLGHLPWPRLTGPFPVILMRYDVRDVLRATPKAAAHPFAVPTQLDQGLNEVFHPAPRAENYGRTLNLGGDVECERLAAEVLHLPIPYAPRHIWKVGVITTRADVSPEKVGQLREDHLFCLRYLSDPDFGKL